MLFVRGGGNENYAHQASLIKNRPMFIDVLLQKMPICTSCIQIMAEKGFLIKHQDKEQLKYCSFCHTRDVILPFT